MKRALSLFVCLGLLVRCTSLGVGSSPSATTQERPETRAQSPKDRKVALVVGGVGVASYATVGILKKFAEEGLEVEFIISTGWPTPFALANGFLKSVHDLEWFATRLEESDFKKVGSVDFRRDIDPSEELPSLIVKSFPQQLLNQARVPVIIAATNTDLGEPDVFGSGEWKEPLLRTLSVPGLYRRFPTDRGTGWIEQIQGLDVREATRRGATTLVAVSMYDDYVGWLTKKPRADDELFRRLYAAQIRKTTQESLKLANYSASLSLNRDPTDFSAKRAAILAGYREGAKLVRKIRETADSTAN